MRTLDLRLPLTHPFSFGIREDIFVPWLAPWTQYKITAAAYSHLNDSMLDLKIEC